MKRVIMCNTSKQYYHYDDRFIKKGELISPTPYQGYKIAIEAYQSVLGEDPRKFIYLLGEPNEEYFEGYTYEYTVSANSVHRVYMDYSYPICCMDIGACESNFNRLNPGEKFSKEEYVDLMSRAYVGDSQAMQELEDRYGYTKSSNIEYLATECRVLSRRKDPQL